MELGRIRQRLSDVPWAALSGVPLPEGIAEVLAGRPAERVVDGFLRKNDLPADGRRAAAEALFGISLWRRRLAARLGERRAHPPQLLFAFLVDLAGLAAAEAARLAGAEHGLTEAALDFADAHSLPDWLADELRAATSDPAEADALATALNLPGPVCLRANTSRVTRDALVERLRGEGIAVSPTSRSPVGLVVAGRLNVLGSPSHQEGLFEVQDEGSQLAGLLVEARPGERILDACAGAGGKTLLLAAEMTDQGQLFAFDPDAEKLERLLQRSARAGVRCIRVLSAPPRESLRVDRALVDAPCSELGALRRGPDLRWRIDPGTFASLPARQLDILERTARHVFPGGRLVYATCTFRRAENEDVVAAFLERHLDFAADAVLRTWPHRDGADGFYACALSRH